MKSRLKIFYLAILLTTLLPYLPFILPFIPGQAFGFNLTGWAWMIMLVITLTNLFMTRSIEFPVLFWVPWVLYMVTYLIIDFSFLGLQLTMQYTLPILIGIVASGFTYSEENLEWLFKWFTGLISLIYIMFLYANLFGSGFSPGMAVLPMVFSIAISLLAGLLFITGKNKYLFYVIILFIAPVVELTRMGIAAITAVFVLHFANRSIKGKLLFGAVGVLAFIIVFNSKPFQEKTFYLGHGAINDLSFNYYESTAIRTNARGLWKKALEPGLKASPIWGNGPRADNAYLSKITKKRGGEAHNDYLSVRFNYGYVGLALLLFGFGSSFLSLYRLSIHNREDYYIWLLSTSALTLFIAFLMFMYSDNILKYTIYFPNYFFALIGIIYSLKRDEDISGNTAIQ